jgi:hypothetical protein
LVCGKTGGEVDRLGSRRVVGDSPSDGEGLGGVEACRA